MTDLPSPETPHTHHDRIDLAPFLLPEYWDGHTIGYGATTPIELPGFPSKEGQFAASVLLNDVHARDVTPIHTFRSGETFDPREYHPGTVVLYREEALKGLNYNLTFEEIHDIREGLGSSPLPIRQTTTSPSYGPNTPSRRAYVDPSPGEEQYHCGYSDGVKWGVVSRVAESGILNIAAASLRLKGHGLDALDSVFMLDQGSLTIGETKHGVAPRGSSELKGLEMVSRVNILHLLAYGSPEKSRKTFFGLTGRTALGGAST